MLVDYSKAKNIYIVTGRTDMRMGIDGLAALVVQKFSLDLFDGALFLFCGTRKDRFKALYFDQDGFLLLYKRIENGRLQWPKNSDEALRLSAQQLRWLLEGLSPNPHKAIRPAVPGPMF